MDYGVSGNVETMTVHGQCTDAPGQTCEVNGTGLTTQLGELRTECICTAEQHYHRSWGEAKDLASSIARAPFLANHLNRTGQIAMLPDGARAPTTIEEWANAIAILSGESSGGGLLGRPGVAGGQCQSCSMDGAGSQIRAAAISTLLFIDLLGGGIDDVAERTARSLDDEFDRLVRTLGEGPETSALHVTDAVGAGAQSQGRRNASLAGGTRPRTGVPFDADGYPDFSNYLHPDHPSIDVPFSGNRPTDVARALGELGMDATPSGYVWHHHQNGHTLQLVRGDIHGATGHSGGHSGH